MTSTPEIDLTTVSFSKLVDLIREGEMVVAGVKAKQGALSAELNRRTQQTGISRLETLNKTHGTAKFERDGVFLQAEAKQTVSWDNDRLKAIAGNLPWETANRLFDIKFSMPERVYGGIVDADFLAKINEARTTKVAPVKVTLA